MYAAGAWSSDGGPQLPVMDPATGERAGSVIGAAPEGVTRILEGARDAQPAWQRLSPPMRAAVLRQIRDVLHRHVDDLAEVLVVEGGKPLAEARGEVQWAGDYVEYMAQWDRRIEGQILPSDAADERIELLRVPIGVVAAICPWNYPIAVMMRKLAPALLMGNAVVVKPSEVTPASSVEAMRLIAEEVDLPPGVVNLVSGGKDVGAALVASPLVGLVSMTGHRDTGKAIMAAAARNLTRVSLELGGKAPAIVCADANLDSAIEALIFARFQHSGQVCTAAERVLVDERIFDDFTERYVAAARDLRVGDPFGDVDMGPVVSEAQFAKVEGAVARAVDSGAAVLTGGGRPSGDEFRRGYWLAPTVLTRVSPEMDVMVEETFGPVTPIWPFAALEDALEVANHSRYGLSGFVFTSDYRTAMQTVERLQCGEVYVNRTHGESMQGFHVGHRESGIGGEDGLHGVLEYTQLKTVYHAYG